MFIPVVSAEMPDLSGNSKLKSKLNIFGTDKPAMEQIEVDKTKIDIRGKLNLFDENKEERRERVCENIEERVDGRVERFREHRLNHGNMYTELLDKLRNIVARMQEFGLDTEALEVDIESLDVMVGDYSDLLAQLIDSIDNVRGYACGDKDEDFREYLADSKELLKSVRDQRIAIREFYRDEIREDIKDLRTQAVELNSSEEMEDE